MSIALDYIKARNSITIKHTGIVMYTDTVDLSKLDVDKWVDSVNKYVAESRYNSTNVIPTQLDPVCGVAIQKHGGFNCSDCQLVDSCGEHDSAYNQLRKKIERSDELLTELDNLNKQLMLKCAQSVI